MIADLEVRWVLTVLFALSATYWCASLVSAKRGAWPGVVARGLHLIMAVAMAVMSWPRGGGLPTVVAMVFFVIATGWFICAAVASVAHRVVNGYHAVMMLAMAWMYAVMNGNLLPGRSAGHQHQMAMGAGHMHMKSMDLAGMQPASSGPAGWITVVNWTCVVGFAIAAVVWTHSYFAVRQGQRVHNSHHNGYHPFGNACQAMMAAGMAVMFGAML